MWTRISLKWLALLLYFSGLTHLFFLVRRKILRRYGVYVLTYHHVVGDSDSDPLGHHVTAKRFEEQLHFIKRWFNVVSLREALQLLANGPLRRDYVVITFDDGYMNNYKFAFPILRKLGIPATIFLITGLVGTNHLPWYDECNTYLRFLVHADLLSILDKKHYSIASQLQKILKGRGDIEVKVEQAVNFLKTVDHEVRQDILLFLRTYYRNEINNTNFRIMTWDQVREMSSHGITFGSHTVTHPILTKLQTNQIEKELRISKDMIEQKLGIPCELFAFPNGEFDTQSTELLRMLGYRSACTQVYGSNRSHSDYFSLKRIGIGNINSYVLAAKLSGILSPIFHIRHQWKRWRPRLNHL